MSDISLTEHTGCTFPESLGLSIGSSNQDIDAFLYSISPTIKITAINTHAISLNTFKSIINALTNATSSGTQSKSFSSEGINTFLSSIDSTLNISNSNSLPPSINLFFNTITHYSEDIINLVITSSPQIKIDLTKGWKANQSIFNFLKEMIGNNSLLATLFGDVGVKVGNFFSNAAGLVQNAMQMTGRDIQLGPYWSFSNSPLSNYPEFSMETVLINDSSDHYEKNKEIVELLTMKYLPTTEEGSDYRFKPPYLFNIEIGVNFGFIKRMYFCKATFNVTETGKYFINPEDGKKVPEFFKVSCHFTSLLSDMQNLSEGFEYSENRNNIEYTGPKVTYVKKESEPAKQTDPLDDMLDSYEKDHAEGKHPAIAMSPDAVRARVGRPVQHYDPETGFNPANPRDTSHMKVGPWRSW